MKDTYEEGVMIGHLGGCGTPQQARESLCRFQEVGSRGITRGKDQQVGEGQPGKVET
jgi:hypothetical protein